VPYRITFKKQLDITEPEQYINDCCVGGDLVLDHLLPSLRGPYQAVQADQEDWGWFAWFEQDGVKLSIDVHTEDAQTGEFVMLLTSSLPNRFFGSRIEDTPSLEVVKALVEEALAAWLVEALTVERTDNEYNPR